MGRTEESIEPAELHSLLMRLHLPEPVSYGSDEYATVAAVCEATGESEQRVWEVLRQIREEDISSRIEQRLREAEEPLYRVERPGFERDPLDTTTNLLARRGAIRTILDGLPRADSKSQAKPSKVQAKHDMPSRLAAYFVLAWTIAFLGLIGLVALIAELHALVTQAH